MRKLSILMLLVSLPLMSHAQEPDCKAWSLDKAKEWLKSSNIVDSQNLSESKMRITLLATEQKSKNLYTLIYHFIFYDNQNKAYDVITKSKASKTECFGDVDSYFISKRQINHLN